MVFDASALYAAVVDPTCPAGPAVADADTIHSPELFAVEVLNTIRSNRVRGRISRSGAHRALTGLQSLPIIGHSLMPLLDRIWALHENLTAYDAAYVAPAECLGEPLVTADARIARAPGIRCEVRVLELA
jgi:predicted nucleic acid-binding protein